MSTDAAAPQTESRGGFRDGPRGRGGRGRGGRGGDRGGPRGARRGDDKGEWVPATKLGRLVKGGQIKSLEQIYLFALPVKEAGILDHFLGSKLKDEVMKIMPVQKMTNAGQRTKFKAFVCVGDNDGHVGLGVKCAAEVATAIRGAISAAKLSMVPVRRGYWGAKFGDVHTVPIKVTGKCGSVRVRLIPAPKGTGIVAAECIKKFLHYAGYLDCYTASNGHTKTMGNFLKAAFDAVSKTYTFLTPDLWTPTHFTPTPFQEFSDYLRDNKTAKVAYRKSEDREAREPRAERH